MSKVLKFVVAYSVILLILFAIFCYLMSTINPVKIIIREPVEKGPAESDSSDSDDDSKRFEFGLGRHSLRRSNLSANQSTLSKIVAHYRHLQSRGAFVDDYVDVMPSTTDAAIMKTSAEPEIKKSSQNFK